MRTLAADQKRCLEIIEAWHTPMVYHPGGWGDDVPKWFLERAIAGRVAMIDDGGWTRATDAEVSGYLMTASLCFPFDNDWTNITCYEAAQNIPQLYDVLARGSDGKVMFGETLTEYQQRELNDLKIKIRNSQIKKYKEKSKEVIMSKRKIVIDEREGVIMVGVMKDGTDPIVSNLTCTLEESLIQVPTLLQEAEVKWTLNPRNPAYVAPKEPPKPAATPKATTPKAKPAASTAKPAGELPLLAGEESPAAPASTPLEAVASTSEKADEVGERIIAAKQEEHGTTPAEISPAVGQLTHGPEKVTSQDAEKAGAAPGSAAPGGAVSEAKATPGAGSPAQISPNSSTPAPSSPPASGGTPGAPTGVWEYRLEDGRGPFESVQLAMDVLGMDKATRPQHNRWDRLSTDLKKRIQRVEKKNS